MGTVFVEYQKDKADNGPLEVVVAGQTVGVWQPGDILEVDEFVARGGKDDAGVRHAGLLDQDWFAEATSSKTRSTKKED